MELPKYIVIGKMLEETIARRVRLNGFRKCLMITSRTPLRVFGEKILSALEGGVSCDVCFVDEVVENFDRYVSYARSFDVVLGVGGGRVADIAKPLAEYSGKQFFSIPTVASHDGIASPMTSYRQNGLAYSRKSVMPSEVFADMDVISLAPRKYVLSGCGDLLGKHSAVRDWWLAHRIKGEYYGRYAAHLAYLSATVVIKSARLIGEDSGEGVRTVVEALISAGISMGVAGSSRPCSGSEHLIAHALESMMEKPALHGERVGVAAVFTSYLHRADWRKIMSSLRTMGASHKLSHIGVDEELFTEAVVKAPDLRKERYTILHHKPPTKQQIREILHDTELV